MLQVKGDRVRIVLPAGSFHKGLPRLEQGWLAQILRDLEVTFGLSENNRSAEDLQVTRRELLGQRTRFVVSGHIESQVALQLLTFLLKSGYLLLHAPNLLVDLQVCIGARSEVYLNPLGHQRHFYYTNI